MTIKEYIKLKYPEALKSVRYSKSAKKVTGLTDYEKAIIYKYTDDGYVVNETLRDSKGQKMPEFAVHLNAVLGKLPSLMSEEALVYRGIPKTNFILNIYRNALKEHTILTEHGFIATSKSRRVACHFGQALLIIHSKNGKSVENISKFGTDSPFNEQEVVFQSGSQFIVLDIEEENNNTIIILEEL